MTGNSTYADWIAVDWGTSHLRAWAMANNGSVQSKASSEKGMSRLAPEDFEAALLELIDPWIGPGQTQVLACGMVGSRQGWVEAPYLTTPCMPLESRFARPSCMDKRLQVHVLPGIKQANPADVMRGEEVQIAGFQASNPKFDGILCLPGTHTKWVEVSAGEVVSFQTFMTGEMFAALCNHTVLRHTVGAVGWDDDAFLEAVSDAMSKPERLAARLFSLRAEGLLHGLEANRARSRLSGQLIGAELAAAQPYWLGQNLAIIGASQIAGIYAAALTQNGATPVLADAETMTLAGLTAAHMKLKEKHL